MNNKCQYGFYSCEFIGNNDFCNSCDGGQNYQMKEEKRGGSRPGSGRKSLGIAWKTVSFRIKEEWREPIKLVVRAEIKRQKLKDAKMRACDDAIELLQNLQQTPCKTQLICPECENLYPHSHTDGSYSCEDCGHTWAN